MSSKEIIFNEDVRKALKRGVDAVGNAVKITIGPRGRNVALDKGYGAPTITNDGVSIAKDITLKDKFENMGAEIIKEVASKTNDTAGDGTSTAVILTQAIINEGMKRTALGANAMNVRRGIDEAMRDTLEELKKMSKEVKSNDEIKQIATVAAENEDLGTVIAETIEKVGKDGVVTVEESQSFGIESDIVEGLEFDNGYVSPYMVTNSERMEAEYKDVSVLITDKKISTVKDILPLLEKLAQTGSKDLVIIADDCDGEALATFVVNKLRGAFNVLVVKAPGYGDRKKEMLQDIAITVGAQVISEDIGLTLEKAELEHLGKANRVVSSKDSTVVIGGKGEKSSIEERVESLKSQLEGTQSKFDKEKLEERIAKLAGGVAVIKVGAATETEMKYLKLKIEDAVNATKAAIEEGIVPGGGTALAKIAHRLTDKLETKKGHNPEFTAGYEILLKALLMPLYQIAYNAGREDGAMVVVNKVASDEGSLGFNAISGEYVNMLEKGIIDPVKVARSGVENAASAAAILLTTDAAIADEPEEDKPAAPDMGAMGGMGGMGGMM